MDQGFKKMDDGFKRVDGKFKEAEKHTDKKIDGKIDKLALAVKKGFDENTKEHQEIFKLLDKHINKLDNLEQGQERNELRLGQAAFRFEIQDLDKRLKRVEAKVG